MHERTYIVTVRVKNPSVEVDDLDQLDDEVTSVVNDLLDGEAVYTEDPEGDEVGLDVDVLSVERSDTL